MQPSQPKVSLITTVYNRENYLPQAIESILTQTHQNLELILWDDGSTDDSLEICHHYAHQDDRIRVIPAPHQGRGPSVAQASALATGQYIGIVDSDDLLAQDALTETVNYLEQHPSIGMVYTDYIIIAEDNSIKGYGQHYLLRKTNRPNLLRQKSDRKRDRPARHGRHSRTRISSLRPM